MNITTVRDNLKKTISGKEMLLDTYRNPSMNAYPKDVKAVMIQFLEINLAELNAILTDVEVCCQKATETSWATDPDRSGA